MNQIIADLKGKWYRLKLNKIYKQSFMDQTVKSLDQGEMRSVKNGRGDTEACCLSPILLGL
jgi:hypothetical protein